MIWTVEIDKFSIGSLTHKLAAELNIGSNQLVSVWYYDKVLGQDVQLLYDQQPSLMFEMYAAELNVPLTVVVMDVTGSSASNSAENHVEFVPISVVPADDPLVIGTKSNPGVLRRAGGALRSSTLGRTRERTGFDVHGTRTCDPGVVSSRMKYSIQFLTKNELK